MPKPSASDFDRTRMAYAVAAALDALAAEGLSANAFCAKMGLARAAVSRLRNGLPVGGGPTFVVLTALGIDPLDMLAAPMAERLRILRHAHAQMSRADEKAQVLQAVSNLAPRETRGAAVAAPSAEGHAAGAFCEAKSSRAARDASPELHP